MRIFTLALALLALAVPAISQIGESGSFSELVDVNRLMYPRNGITYQVSSFDRTGGNDDGFSGKYSFVRKEGENLVIFDEQGPGCIYRIWSANPGGGWVKFYFDGETEPRIAVDHFEDLFKGNYPPFVKPLSVNFLGGWNSYVPVGFQKSCKIVAQGPVAFLQITWRKFIEREVVNTFTRDLPPQEKYYFDQAVAAWSNPGEPPVPFQSAACKTVKKQISSGSNIIKLAEMDGTGIVRALKLRLKSEDVRALRKVVLRTYTDGKSSPDVWSPVGDFFMTGFGGVETRGLMIGVKDGQMYSYFPMPYVKGMRIELVNDTGKKLDIDAEISCESVASLPPDAMRFFAWWHRQNPTQNGQPFPILDVKGKGHWLGVSHYMHGFGGLGFLEGDEMLWVDGRDYTHYNGTGTEDYFNCGWYFGNEGCQPLYGCTVFDDPGSMIHAYRIHLTDLVPFKKDARIVIEHGPGNDINADYAGVTYWYAESSTTHQFAAVPVRERLMRSTQVRGAAEAEGGRTIVSSGSVNVVEDLDLLLTLSGGKGIKFTPADDNGRITYTVKSPDTASYDLYAWIVTGPSGGKVEAIVDGASTGVTIDTYSKIPQVGKFILGTENRLRAGEHHVTLVGRGKNKKSSGQEIFIDCLKLDVTGNIEAEDLKIVKMSGPLDIQGMGSFLGWWSNSAQYMFHPNAPGEFTLELPVEKAGKYHLWAYMTMAADYGIFQLKLDGKPLGQPFDGYNNGVIRSPKLDFGTMDLSEGKHELSVEVTGKNEKSTGFFAGFDCVILNPVK